MTTPTATLPDFDAVRRLPEHIPGRIIELKLVDLPTYLANNGLVPCGLSATGALLVKKEDA